MKVLTDDSVTGSAAHTATRGAGFPGAVEPTAHAWLPVLAPGFRTVTFRPAPLGPFAQGEFPDAGRPGASHLDYDVPFIPVVSVTSPIRVGMCALLSRFAVRVPRWERRGPKTEAAKGTAAGPGTLLPGGDPPTAPKP
jgi:hypothetical protein